MLVPILTDEPDGGPAELLRADPKSLDLPHPVGTGSVGMARRRAGCGGPATDDLPEAIRDTTREAYAEIQPSQDGPTCAALLACLVALLAELGILPNRVLKEQ